MANLQAKDRVIHWRTNEFISIEQFGNGLAEGFEQLGFPVKTSIVSSKVIKDRLQCVKVVVKDKRIPDLYFAQTSMGKIPYLDMFLIGGRDAMHMAKGLAFGAIASALRPREMPIVGGVIVPGLIGNHQGKKIAADHAATNDFLEVVEQDIIPYAYDYALNASANGNVGYAEQVGNEASSGGASGNWGMNPPQSAQPAGPTPEQIRAQQEAELARQQQAAAAAAAERERQQREAAAAAERARQQQAAAAAERARQEQAAAAERARQQQVAAAERARQQQIEAERRRKAEEARKAAEKQKRKAARTAESNTLNKLVLITREEARAGCTKVIDVEKGRSVTVKIPAGVNYDSHLEVPGEGRLDSEFGVRGILRLSFAFSD